MKITIRERRISADYTVKKDGTLSGGKMITQYAVIVDGRCIDSFITKARAEQRVAELQEKANA